MTTDSPGARAQLAQKVTKELYDAIKKPWIRHSKAEDARDLDGLIATLAEDCVNQIIPTSKAGKATRELAIFTPLF